jgi:hypothetical protein
MSIKNTLLTLAALVLLAAAYRFASHGIRLHDNRCIGFACIAVLLAVLALAWMFRNRRRQRA